MWSNKEFKKGSTVVKPVVSVVWQTNLPPLSFQLMYYWVGVTEAVKSWIKACAVCQNRSPCEPREAYIQYCLCYGCDASSYTNPELSFHRSDTTFTQLLKLKNRKRQILLTLVWVGPESKGFIFCLLDSALFRLSCKLSLHLATCAKSLQNTLFFWAYFKTTHAFKRNINSVNAKKYNNNIKISQ